MIGFNKNKKTNQCYLDDTENKMCIPIECNNIYPVKSGWTLYGLEWCPFNKRAQELLNKKNISYYYYNIEKEPFNGRDNFKTMMSSYLNGQKTTPAVFKDGVLIGGYSDLDVYFKS